MPAPIALRLLVGRLLTQQNKGKRVGVIRDIVREICGLAPYEKRVLDILKGGGASSEKRAYKFAKRRVSPLSRRCCCRDVAQRSATA
jgi:hypothetical protein